jgi:hypothetical protein
MRSGNSDSSCWDIFANVVANKWPKTGTNSIHSSKERVLILQLIILTLCSSSSSSSAYECLHLGTGLPYGIPTRRTGHNPPRELSAGWWVLSTANAAGTNSLTCLQKHGGARENKFLVTHPMTDQRCLASAIVR